MDTNYYHIEDGTYALEVRKGKPSADVRKALPLDGDAPDEVGCVGCGRLTYREDDGTPSLTLKGKVTPEVIAMLEAHGIEVLPMARVVFDTDRPAHLTVTNEQGEVVKPPYSPATVPCCPSCNRGGMRKLFWQRIADAHIARIRKVGRRL